ncbi:OmpA family protein [Paramagnetospirillum magneticum]|uniref:Outer membrane protein and related peptidoglycan-associated lipo protein n=1 Tax=Paramagnetospirillum magneticum (strain ATCC 700264 / AMB-1) TaxID=342108 RepID=Q2W4F1_PARM1|nr:OmpA family protein [Paramagnetospirillum magneticum]BAE51274.1 Outer membrane protein and related peptidoglycan-associated lipo protein [Paramagnetospirillum magneticum AMB-1]
MKLIHLITALTALVAVSACAEMEPMERPTTSTPMVTAPPPPAAPVPSAPMAADDVALPPSPVVVHFNHAKADITGSTMQVLWGLAPALKAAEPGVIRVQGFTDASGKAAYNRILSEKRAQAVADQLRKLGVTARIEVSGQGIVKGGKKGHKDQGARRVEITWEPAAPAKASATSPVSSETVKAMADAPDLGLAGIAGAAPAAGAAEAVSYAGFAPVAGSPLVTDWAVSFEATGPPATLS